LLFDVNILERGSDNEEGEQSRQQQQQVMHRLVVLDKYDAVSNIMPILELVIVVIF